MSYESAVRTEIKNEIFAALGQGQALTAAQLAARCPSAPDSNEVAKICYEMRVKKCLLEFGADYHAPGNRPVKTYQMASVDATEAWAARQAASIAVAKAQPKKTKQSTATPASAGHPWKQPAVAVKAPRAPRVTRPLPSHLQSVAPPPVAIEETPVAATEVVAIETPVVEPPADIDAALIAALKQVLPAMQRAAADLPKAIDPPTTEEAPMTEDTAPYIPAPDTFTLEPESAEDESPVHVCQGHCSNHAVEQERQALMDTVARDLLEYCRLSIVDAIVLYAARELRGDLVWDALYQAYGDAAIAKEVCHG